jgi:hypothetical protein
MGMGVFVVMIMVVVMIVAIVGVTVAVASVTMSMAMIVCSVEGKDSDQVDQEAQGTDNQQLGGSTDIGSRKQAFNGFVDNLDADEHQEDAVPQAS